MKKIKNPWIGKKDYNCFGCAPDNPIGLHMEFYADEDDKVIGVWQPQKNYEGLHNVVHGGIQALMLDETAAWWGFYYRQSVGVTSRMEVKYRKPVLISDGEVKVIVTHLADQRGYVQLHAELQNGKGETCTTADLVYYQYSKEISASQFGFTDCTLE